MDVHYVENRGMWLDLRIIGRTITNVLTRRRDTYEKRYSSRKERESD